MNRENDTSEMANLTADHLFNTKTQIFHRFAIFV